MRNIEKVPVALVGYGGAGISFLATLTLQDWAYVAGIAASAAATIYTLTKWVILLRQKASKRKLELD